MEKDEKKRSMWQEEDTEKDEMPPRKKQKGSGEMVVCTASEDQESAVGHESSIWRFLKHLPVKDILRARSVSKAYNALTRSRYFLDAPAASAKKEILLKGYSGGVPIVCFRSQETLHETRDRVVPMLNGTEISFPLVCRSALLGCVHGIVCLYSKQLGDIIDVVLWNPATKIARRLPSDLVQCYPLTSANLATPNIGFGFDPSKKEVKVLLVHQRLDTKQWIYTSPYEIGLYRFSQDAWCLLKVMDLPKIDVNSLSSPAVCSDNLCSWVVSEKGMAINVLSFLMDRESFITIPLPPAVRGRLVTEVRLLQYDKGLALALKQEEGVILWQLDPRPTFQWLPLYEVPVANNEKLLALTQSGPVLEVGSSSKLVLFDALTRQRKNLVDIGKMRITDVTPYTESLELVKPWN